mmetsp:Transcript_104588/g.293089  ORF Transcript_104588/g.293089 Transcript_104588/m.293089 type:complete len:538 (-) Transcript_104588:654-2267(-)
MCFLPCLLSFWHETTIQTLNQHVLVFRTGSCKDLELGKNFVQLCRGQFSEFLTSHGNAVFSQNSSLFGNSTSSFKVISSDHSDENSSVLARRNSFNNVLTKWIGNPHKSIQTQFLFKLLLTFCQMNGGQILCDFIDSTSVCQGNAAESITGELLNDFLEIFAFLFGHFLFRSIHIHVGRAAFQNDFSSTLVVKCPGMLLFGNQNSHALAAAREWKKAASVLLTKTSLLTSHVRNIITTPIRLGKNDQCSLCFVSNQLRATVVHSQFVVDGCFLRRSRIHYTSSRAASDAFEDCFQCLFRDVDGFRTLLIAFVGKNTTHNGHAILGQGTRLVGADIGGISHRLTCRQVADEILVSKHFLGRKRERDGDRQGQTFWNSNHDDCYTNDKGIKSMMKDTDMLQIFRVDENLDCHHGNEGGRCGTHTDISNHCRHVIKFLLEWGFFLLLLQFALDHAPLGILADGNGHKTTRPSNSGAPREQKRIRFGVLVNVFRFARQSRFVDFQAIVGDYDTVTRDVVSCFHTNKVSHHKIIDRDRMELS